MRPRLTGRGLQLLAVGALYGVVGVAVERPYLVTLGGAALLVLLVTHVRAVAAAERLAAGRLRLSWRIDHPEGRRALEPSRPFDVTVRLTDDGVGFATASIGAYASSALEVRRDAPAVMRGGSFEVALSVRAHAAGSWWLHGAWLDLRDNLGLFSAQAFFPTPIRVRVLPAMPSRRFRPPAAARGDGEGQRGRRSDRQGSELAEIREAVPGDPYRHLAWKATARTGRLMVRRFHSESPIDQILCLDRAMGGTDARPLDRAIASLAARARAALDAGDRVGLVIFDDRVRAQVPPGDRRKHLGRLLDTLLLHRSQPDDSTLSDAEVIAAVTHYLSWQEGVSLRVAAPPLDSARWNDLCAGPSGDLYEARELDHVIQAVLAREAPEALRAAGKLIDRARLLIRARGIETPRRTVSIDDRLRGLDEAVRLADRERRSTIALWTDLDPGSLARLSSVRRARQRHGLTLLPGAVRLAA